MCRPPVLAGNRGERQTHNTLTPSHAHTHIHTIRRPPVLAGNRGGLREIEGPGACRRRQAAAEHLQRLAPCRPHDAGCLCVSHLTVALEHMCLSADERSMQAVTYWRCNICVSLTYVSRPLDAGCLPRPGAARHGVCVRHHMHLHIWL